jgi:sugar phosphate isomerase/epimerase
MTRTSLGVEWIDKVIELEEQKIMQTITRRGWLAGAAAGLAHSNLMRAADGGDGVSICAFSKHFQWTDLPSGIGMIAELGYDGVDLTVRNRGHVLPERVEEDLPRVVELIHKAGLQIPMITAGIRDTQSPHAEAIIKTMKTLGIPRYRWGGFRYDEKRSITEQLAEYKVRVRDLAALNKQYGVCAMYHTHSGIGQVGASFWDLYLLLKDFDPDQVSVNYDIGHATVEGGFGGWINSTRLLLPYTRGVAVKDFLWKRNGKGEWRPSWCPLGKGMVDFNRYFAMLKAGGFSGPVQLHMEYDELGGADSGKSELTIPKAQVLKLMRQDIDTLKRMFAEAGLA